MQEVIVNGRKETEGAPERKPDSIDAVLDTLGALVMVLDPAGRIVRFNRACEQTTGYLVEEVKGRPFWDYVVADEAEAAERAFARLQTGQFPRDHECHWLAKDGSQRLIAWSNSALLAEDGSVEYVTSTGIDVTERRRAEGILRDSAEKLEKLFELLPIGVSILDQDRNVVKANSALSRILGLSARELEHGSFRERRYLTAEGALFPPHDFPSVRAFEEQRVIHDAVIGVEKEDGELIWTSVSAVPVLFPDWRVVVVTTDITKRKRFEQALRQQDNFTASLLETSRSLVIVLDFQGRIVDFNRACEQATGYTFEEVQGKAFWDLIVPPEDVEPVKAEFAQLQAGRVPSTFESYLQAKDGSRRWIAWSNTALPGEGGSIEYVIGTGIDITEHREAEEELRRTLASARQRQSEVSALLKGAHQVLARRPFEDTARSIFDTCKELTGATAGYVALSSRNGAENDVLFLDSGGNPCAVDPALPMPIRGLRGQVYRTGTVAYENDFRSSPWTRLLPEGHVGVDNLLFAPLVISGQVVGLLGLANKPGGFSEDDARVAAAFGELVAIALHNSRLMESLETSELRFRSVVETANAAIATTDSQGRVTFWNRMAETIFGFTAEEMVGTPLTLVIPERYREAHHAAMYRVLSTGKTRLAGETVETIGTRKGGAEFPLEMSLAVWTTGEDSSFTVLMQDISQRRQFEEALRVANQSMETLIRSSPLAIIAVDLDLKVRLWNPAAQRIFGWSESEVLGRPEPLTPQPRQGELQGLLALASEGGSLSGTETVLYRRDGCPVDVSIWTAPLYDAQGNIRTVMAVIADITTRRQADEELRRYAQEQTALYSVTSAVAGTLDQDELLIVVLDAVLPALEADAGWILLPSPKVGGPAQVVAQRSTAEGLLIGETLLPSQHCPAYQCPSLEDGAWVEPELVVACPALAAEGTDDTELHSLVCVPLCVGQKVLGVLKLGWRQPYAHEQQRQGLLLSIGRQVGVALHAAQLYEAARQVDHLRVLHELDRALAATLDLRKLVEVALQHVATALDAPAASMLLGPHPAQDQPPPEAFIPDQGWKQVLPSSQEATYWQGVLGRVEDQRATMPFVDSESKSPNVTREPIHQSGAHDLVIPIWGEKALLAVLVLGGRQTSQAFADDDLSLARVAASHVGQAMQNAQLYQEVRRLLQEQEQTQAQLIQIEKLSALGRLAAMIAHEINNPLQAVQSCLTLAHEELGGSHRRDKVDRYLAVAGGEVERISAIVRRMRDYYRPALERLQPTDLHVVLDGVLDLSGKELQHRKIAVERFDGGELPLVQANPDHLKQVFLNLVLNAMDAMPTGGVLSFRTSLGQIQAGDGDQPEPAVCIEISDTGHGIPRESQARLFEPFFTTKEQGAGLGLSISHGIIDAHKGQISFHSEEGVGTTFSILLPAAPP